jgi:protein-S-isoprenylcysteine O-methyltransferase Ste14
MIIKEYEKSGYWLFNQRSYIPLILLVLAIVYIWDTTIPFWHDVATLNGILENMQTNGEPQAEQAMQEAPYLFLKTYWKWISLGVSFLGIFVRALTIGFTPKSTSGRNTNGQVADTLNTKGIYACVRHPLYFGNILMWAGILMYPGDIWLALIGLTFFWLYYERIMIAEEGFLFKKFGSVYTDWADTTPMFIPDFSKWKSADLDFSFANVLKREYPGVLATAISFFFTFHFKYFCVFFNVKEPIEQQPSYFEWLKDYFSTPFDGVNYPDYFWLLFLILALTATVVIKLLRKTTRIFEVEGR